MTEKQDLGQEGEEEAVNYLVKNKFKILERNYRSGHLELDIIAKKDDILVFVEVRLRATDKHGYPEELMSKSKINAVKRAAEAYVIEKNYDGDLRFDFISIIKYPKFDLMHFEDAYF